MPYPSNRLQMSKVGMYSCCPLTYLTSFQKPSIQILKNDYCPGFVPVLLLIKIPIFCYCELFLMPLTLQRFLVINEKIYQSESKQIKICDYLYSLSVQLAVSAQSAGSGTISGRITSSGGEAVSYATVRLKGTANAAHTDIEGIYQIKAPAGATVSWCRPWGTRPLSVTSALRPAVVIMLTSV